MLKEPGVTGLLHFSSRWLPLETILPFKLLPGAASRCLWKLWWNYQTMLHLIYIITFCFYQQAVYKHYDPNGSLTLQHFIIFFGAFELLLSQFPDIHSLRWLNALCTLSTIGFASTAIGVTIYSGSLESCNSLIAFHAPLSIWLVARMIVGKRADRSLITYSLQGSSSDKVFRLFNALGAIAFSFGDAMLPEIQVSSPALSSCCLCIIP